ncbi:helix-turn-helix domain-containing protein [Nonlabens sp.]|uniref:helix-turn-helix domain-containing protein n=1 Tax=Nonlabens sp. TaxID=1888209 RepID=UPI003F69823E
MQRLGEHLRKLRSDKGISQEELAELSTINLRTIQRIENNETSPRKSTLELICEALEIEPSRFNNSESLQGNKTLSTKIIHYIFLFFINILLMGVVGYLTLDHDATFHSRIGAYLLSFFIPYFIVFFTQKLPSGERLLKYGMGYLFYFISAFYMMSF